MASGGDARLLKSTKFPPEFNQKVDMQKVNVHVVKKYAYLNKNQFLEWADSLTLRASTDGLPVASQRFLATTTMLLSSCALALLKAPAMYVSTTVRYVGFNRLTRTPVF